MTLFRCREACPRLASAYVRTRRLFPANLSSACLSQHLVPPRCFIPPSSSSCRTSSTPSSTPPRTTWKGTPLHELWLTDPDGNLVEIYARLTEEELFEKPEDEAPVALA